MLASNPRMILAIAALFVPLSGLSGADDKDKVVGDLKKAQGKWTAPSADGTKVTYAFEGKTLKLVAPTRSYTMTVTLDADAKPEKTIDFLIDEGPEDSKGKTSKGIYKFDGDDFVFCFSPQGDRPTKYEQEGYEKIVVKLTKAKD